MDEPKPSTDRPDDDKLTRNPTRMGIAEAGEKPPYTYWRTATFFFAYDWETRAKRVWVVHHEGSKSTGYPDDNTVYGPNEHLYRIQCNLPPPVAANGEGGPTTIDIPASYTREELETLPVVPPEFVIDYMAQRLFGAVDSIVPRGTFMEGSGGKYTGLTACRTESGFDFTCSGGKFKITIEKID
jgi:hypothetical protein